MIATFSDAGNMVWREDWGLEENNWETLDFHFSYGVWAGTRTGMTEITPTVIQKSRQFSNDSNWELVLEDLHGEKQSDATPDEAIG